MTKDQMPWLGSPFDAPVKHQSNSLPEVHKRHRIKMPSFQMPKFHKPKVDMPKLPKFHMPKVQMPKLRKRKIKASMPDISKIMKRVAHAIDVKPISKDSHSSYSEFEQKYDDWTAGMLGAYLVATVIICALGIEAVNINTGTGAVVMFFSVIVWLISVIGAIFYSGKAQLYHKLQE